MAIDPTDPRYNSPRAILSTDKRERTPAEIVLVRSWGKQSRALNAMSSFSPEETTLLKLEFHDDVIVKGAEGVYEQAILDDLVRDMREHIVFKGRSTVPILEAARIKPSAQYIQEVHGMNFKMLKAVFIKTFFEAGELENFKKPKVGESAGKDLFDFL